MDVLERAFQADTKFRDRLTKSMAAMPRLRTYAVLRQDRNGQFTIKDTITTTIDLPFGITCVAGEFMHVVAERR